MAGGTEETQERARPRDALDVGAVSVAGAFAVLAWIELYRHLDGWIWGASYTSDHRWTYPVLALAFSLVVGLAVKYLHAPTALSESLVDVFRGGAELPRWRRLPAAVVNSLASLLSGAAVGPEAPIGTLSMQVADGWTRLLRRPGARRETNALAAAAAAFNGLLESPIFTAVLANDLTRDRRELARHLPSFLIAGAIGYLVFWAVGTKGFGGYLGVAQVEDFRLVYVLDVVVLAVVGVALAVLTGLLLRLAAGVFARLDGRVVLRALAGGAIAGVAGYFVPVVGFSGEQQIFTLLGDPGHYGKAQLLGLALLKLALLAVAFKTGFMGGPTFPSIFAATAVALGVAALFPGIPLIVILAGITGGQVLVLFRAPFMVILFLAFFYSANQNAVALIVVSVATAMAVLPTVARLQARRQAAVDAPPAPASP